MAPHPKTQLSEPFDRTQPVLLDCHVVPQNHAPWDPICRTFSRQFAVSALELFCNFWPTLCLGLMHVGPGTVSPSRDAGLTEGVVEHYRGSILQGQPQRTPAAEGSHGGRPLSSKPQRCQFLMKPRENSLCVQAGLVRAGLFFLKKNIQYQTHFSVKKFSTRDTSQCRDT